MAKKTIEQTKAIEHATKDFEDGKPASANSTDSAYSTAYYNTFYKLRTEKRLSHIIAKYGPIK